MAGVPRPVEKAFRSHSPPSPISLTSKHCSPFRILPESQDTQTDSNDNTSRVPC